MSLESGNANEPPAKGIGFVPYSPLGKGFLTGKMDESASSDNSDFRSTLPRFTPEALKANRALMDLLGRIAERKQAMPAQIALPWLLAQAGQKTTPARDAQAIPAS